MYLAILLFVSVFAFGGRLPDDFPRRWEGKIQLSQRVVALILEGTRTERGIWTGVPFAALLRSGQE